MGLYQKGGTGYAHLTSFGVKGMVPNLVDQDDPGPAGGLVLPNIDIVTVGTVAAAGEAVRLYTEVPVITDDGRVVFDGHRSNATAGGTLAALVGVAMAASESDGRTIVRIQGYCSFALAGTAGVTGDTLVTYGASNWEDAGTGALGCGIATSTATSGNTFGLILFGFPIGVGS